MSDSDMQKNVADEKAVAKPQAPAPKIKVAPTPPDSNPPVDALAPVNLGADKVSQITKEIGESSGDPIRDAKLMEEHGSLYDPATSDKDTAGIAIGPDAPEPDRVISPQTQAEMDAGRNALNKRAESMVREGGPVPNANVTLPRNPVVESFSNRTGTGTAKK